MRRTWRWLVPALLVLLAAVLLPATYLVNGLFEAQYDPLRVWVESVIGQIVLQGLAADLCAMVVAVVVASVLRAWTVTRARPVVVGAASLAAAIAVYALVALAIIPGVPVAEPTRVIAGHLLPFIRSEGWSEYSGSMFLGGAAVFWLPVGVGVWASIRSERRPLLHGLAWGLATLAAAAVVNGMIAAPVNFP